MNKTAGGRFVGLRRQYGIAQRAGANSESSPYQLRLKSESSPTPACHQKDPTPT